MVDENSANPDSGTDDEDAVLRAVRALDPSSSEEAVRRFLREIADAEAALAGIELDDASPVAGFSPSWDGGATQ